MALPLDFLRNAAAGFRPDTCTIQRATETSDGDGTSASWATLASGVTCRLSRIGQGGNEALGAGGAVRAIGQRRIKLPAGQDVRASDRIVTGGVTYEVVDVPKISNETERTAVCREIS